jgi:hypothetical protein
MSMFRVVLYIPASSPIQLDLEEGISASEAIRKALKCLDTHNIQGCTEEELPQGWRLRARRVVEEGRWWSENDINEYSDRKSGHGYVNQADYQLPWVMMIS